MKLRYTVYIPSKGRAETLATAEQLKEYNTSFKIVVEPQDEAEYLKFWDKDSLIVMKDNDKGMSFVRNFIKQYSIEQKEEFHWQLDDNIKSFKRRVNNKNIPYNPKKLLAIAERYCDRYSNVAIAGLCYTNYAFAKKNKVDVNKQPCSCFLVRNDLKNKWRPELMEDTDYAL